MSRKVVFVAHPISGDIKGNVQKVIAICKAIHTKNVIPVAPYLASLQYLDNAVEEEREIGVTANLECFRRKYIDEVWLYGERITKGMEEEIVLALSLGIPIVPKTTGTEKDLANLKTELRFDNEPSWMRNS